jgi:hypothetical protein
MSWLILIAALALGVPAWAWFAQESLLFFPQPVTSTAHLPARASPLEIVGADGTYLRGWIVKGAAAPAPTVIYFGGNAEEVSWTISDARWPREWSIVGVNYRGYGTSEGKPGEPALTADSLAIYDAITKCDDVDPHHIVVFGRSLGTAIAAHLAARRPVVGAILVSPYDSMTAIGKLHYPWLPVSLLLRHRFDAIPDAKQNMMPMLAIVGESDSIIPPERSRALFDAWEGPKAWLVVPRADHNDLGSDPTFWSSVNEFLAQR